jgi:GntR family transcriptional regulator
MSELTDLPALWLRDHQQGTMIHMPPRQPQIPHQAVADALRERIRNGEWLPGEQLPSVRELAEQFGVSRATTSRAVRTLADEGLVTIVPNWGAFIADSTAPRQP